MSEFFVVHLPGGDDRPIFCTPARSVESVRLLYPEALAVVAVNREAWLKICERLERK